MDCISWTKRETCVRVILISVTSFMSSTTCLQSFVKVVSPVRRASLLLRAFTQEPFQGSKCSDLDELFSRNIRNALAVTFTGGLPGLWPDISSKRIIHEQGEQHGKQCISFHHSRASEGYRQRGDRHFE